MLSSKRGNGKDLPEAFLATSLTELWAIAALTINRAAGTALSFHGITVPTLVLASTDLAAGVVFSKENVSAFEITGQSSRTGLEDGLVGTATRIIAGRSSRGYACQSQQDSWGEMHKTHGEVVE